MSIDRDLGSNQVVETAAAMYNSPEEFGQDRSAGTYNCILYNLHFYSFPKSPRVVRFDRSTRTDSPSYSAPAEESAGERRRLFSARSAREIEVDRFLGWNARLARSIRFRVSDRGRTIAESRPHRRFPACGVSNRIAFFRRPPRGFNGMRNRLRNAYEAITGRFRCVRPGKAELTSNHPRSTPTDAEPATGFITDTSVRQCRPSGSVRRRFGVSARKSDVDFEDFVAVVFES